MEKMIAAQKYELLSKEVKRADPLNKEKFIQVGNMWVYEKALTINGEPRAYWNFPEQLTVLEMYGQREGIRLMHGSLKDNFVALNLKEAQPYIDNVLKDGWAFTGEIGILNNDDFDVRRVLGARFVDSPGVRMFERGKRVYLPVPISTLGRSVEYDVSEVLQRGMAPGNINVNKFSVVPQNGDFDSKGKLNWFGRDFDSDYISTIGCTYLSDAGFLLAHGYYGHFDSSDSSGVVPLWTNENPKN
jgi:hypothetical protein